METDKMGVVVSGIVAAKSEYQPKNGGDRRYTIDIAVPGNRFNIALGCTKEKYDMVKEFSPFQSKVQVSQFNGNLYFQVK